MGWHRPLNWEKVATNLGSCRHVRHMRLTLGPKEGLHTSSSQDLESATKIRRVLQCRFKVSHIDLHLMRFSNCFLLIAATPQSHAIPKDKKSNIHSSKQASLAPRPLINKFTTPTLRPKRTSIKHILTFDIVVLAKRISHISTPISQELKHNIAGNITDSTTEILSAHRETFIKPLHKAITDHRSELPTLDISQPHVRFNNRSSSASLRSAGPSFTSISNSMAPVSLKGRKINIGRQNRAAHPF
jgi:hypothetical protein